MAKPEVLGHVAAHVVVYVVSRWTGGRRHSRWTSSGQSGCRSGIANTPIQVVLKLGFADKKISMRSSVKSATVPFGIGWILVFIFAGGAL